jgi:5,10-methylenetetrahydromethanopterin reductase
MALVYTRIADDERAALDGIRRTMGFILRGPHHAKNVELAGTQLDQTALWNAYRDENWTVVEALVTDAVIRTHAAAGTPAQVRARYDEYRGIGLDDLIVGGVDDSPGISRALMAIR